MTYDFSTRWYIYSQFLTEFCDSKMPLISKSTSSGSQSESPTRKRSIFSSRTTHDDSNANESGLFGRHRSNSSDNESSGGNGFFGLGRNNNIENDPTIRNARKKVADAEKAEKQADIALNEARERVREAREHVQLLEQEAMEG